MRLTIYLTVSFKEVVHILLPSLGGAVYVQQINCNGYQGARTSAQIQLRVPSITQNVTGHHSSDILPDILDLDRQTFFRSVLIAVSAGHRMSSRSHTLRTFALGASTKPFGYRLALFVVFVNT